MAVDEHFAFGGEKKPKVPKEEEVGLSLPIIVAPNALPVSPSIDYEIPVVTFLFPRNTSIRKEGKKTPAQDKEHDFSAFLQNV